MHQFYRGNRWRFALAMTSALITTAAALAASWLLQVILDLANGTDVGFTFSQVLLLALGAFCLDALGYFLAYHSKPKLVAKGVGQYKEYVFTRLCQKGIGAFGKENSSLYISALSNDAATVETGYLTNIFVVAENAAVFLGALVLMFWYNPLLTLLSIVLALR